MLIAKIRRNESRITDTVESASPAAMFSAILTNMSQLDEDDDTDSSDNDDGQILYVEPVDNHLETWVRKCAFSAISVTIDEDEYDELIGVAGECKMKENRKAQALANMVSVAGLLAYRALLQGKKFYEIRVYGLMCNYFHASAHLLCLTLNFRTRVSAVTEFSEPQDIGYQFAAAISLVQQYTSPA
uniref:Uncharacterized protein n=1 Tax=Amphimedon queenslandica TaxID=400682 RepID=A0A1X7SRX7_AMPQE